MKKLLGVIGMCAVLTTPAATAVEPTWPQKTHYLYADVLGLNIFYREAGESNSQTIVLLHGYPSSSHAYRELIPLLSGRYHVIAPDDLGSGLSSKPSSETFEYNFDVLAKYTDGLLKVLNIRHFVLYMQDFGAPVGFRIMMMNPDRIKAIIAQNANAYLEGIPPEKQAFFNAAQMDQSPENIAKLFAYTSPEAVKDKQYLRDVHGHPEVMSPDAWINDSNFLSSESERRIQVKLFQDYKTNLDAYPKWQAFMRRHQFPTLLIWGERDPVFTAAGAKAFLRDLPHAELHLLDAGHFAVEEKPVEVAKLITSFLGYGEKRGTIANQVDIPVE